MPLAFSLATTVKGQITDGDENTMHCEPLGMRAIPQAGTETADTKQATVRLETLCVIPARGGSKGIPHKNIADLHGKPLLAYTIEAARRSGAFSRIIVSTDCERIAGVAREHGAEVPFLRPGHLSSDQALAGDAISHLLDALAEKENYHPRAFANLYPTSPFRTPQTLAYLVSKLAEGYTEVLTVKPVSRRTQYFHLRGGELDSIPHLAPGAVLPFRHYGYFYGQRLDLQGVNRRFLHHIKDKFSLVDIDTPADLDLACRILTQGLFPQSLR